MEAQWSPTKILIKIHTSSLDSAILIFTFLSAKPSTNAGTPTPDPIEAERLTAEVSKQVSIIFLFFFFIKAVFDQYCRDLVLWNIMFLVPKYDLLVP